MRLDHPVFHTPLDAQVKLDPEPRWETEFDDRGTWLVQEGEPGKTVDYGVVSDGHGFEDSPDCERISGGINSKGPYAVAIGRQANLLQWGFYAAPDKMTESAKTVFLNAIVYMRQFDGQRPLVAKKERARGWLRQYLTALEKAIADDNRMVSYYRGKFPPTLAKAEPASIATWLDENEEYLHPDHDHLVVDEELKQLGLSNRKPAFLDWLQRQLAETPGDPVARRLAQRYLPQHVGDDPAAARAWIEKHRDRLFFSDQGGFRWFVDTNAEARARHEVGSHAR